ncbi:LysR family transcriptional regulator [Uliginosibacterium sp. 31-16]|uniref:LysR family transcriptional regulator n=1 Tax=Uliginosibacterium sp. 31-16 TaxID=3068315 RepID=UPI00273E17D5|nr:LysR family transcriptional regulator [Uliginosibacterium sp. 31-16]MDP5238713.1 LysR family transcriptional regulator [Uliginosibacterium sp. 31-16]
MKALLDLDIFVRTVESGSLSATARTLDLTPAAASAALKRLEAELQAPLFVRSTRSLRLTSEGERFLAYCRVALDALREGQAALSAERQQIKGTLQIAAPSDLGRNALLGWLDEFRVLHPQIRFRLQLSDRNADLYRQPVDIALRYGEPGESNLIAQPLAPDNRRVLCAAPAYLARRGAPASPTELKGHDCLCFMSGEDVRDRWRFRRGTERLSVRVTASQVANDGDVVRRWALAAQGIACKSRLDIAGDLATGRLLPLCQDWEGEPAPLYLICPDRRLLTPAIGLLRDFIRTRCEALMPSA